MINEYYLQQEIIKQSIYSPDIVDNSEQIARLIMSPKHFQDGEVDATAFEQIIHSGMSVLRKKDIDIFNKDSLATIKKLSNNGIQEYVGYVQASVNEIRLILIQTYRLFYVLDTATRETTSHADVHVVRTPEIIKASNLPKKSFHQYIRSQIAELFNQKGLINNTIDLKLVSSLS